MVAVSEWQKDEGIKQGGLEIHIAKEVMIIRAEEIDGAVVARSQKTYKDRYGGLDRRLIYFAWKPTNQPTMNL